MFILIFEEFYISYESSQFSNSKDSVVITEWLNKVASK